MAGVIPVLTSPALGQPSARVDMTLPAGLTIAEIIAVALPAAGETTRDLVRVTLVAEDGRMASIARRNWHRVRPHAGVRVVVRIVPGKSFLSSILSIFVSIAAIALGQLWALPLAGALGISTGLASTLITLGVTVLGRMLINALIPPPKNDSRKSGDSYTISGWRNEARPGGVVPFVLGRYRYAPPYAAPPYSEIAGTGVQFVRAIFVCGYGPLYIDDIRIGETPISEYRNVTVEIRNGWTTDGPVTIYPRQVIEEAVNAELIRPLPRDDAGEVIDDLPGFERPVIRSTGLDASRVGIILSFPGGLVRFNDEGKKRTHTVTFRVRYRAAGSEAWNMLAWFDVTAKRADAFHRQYGWDMPYRGRWEIEVTRMTDEDDDAQIQSRAVYAALQTFRPEYPLNMPQRLALVAVRVQGSYQLQGTLDSLNVMLRCFCFDYKVATNEWVRDHTRNPASLFRYVLQSGAFARPVASSGIDFDQLEDWHNFCRIRGLKYDKIIDTEMTLGEVLAEIAAAGRATPRHDGIRWGVVIDRPQTLVVDHINPRNSHSFKASRLYSRKPHAFRVPFVDETNDYQPSERVVRWPGYTGDITITEQLEMPGKTDPNEIWIEARRRMYEAIYRPDVYTVSQDGPIPAATRGDLVMGSFDTLSSTQKAARVRSIEGAVIQLDDMVEMVAGEIYGLRWRKFANSADTIGVSVLHRVTTIAGLTDVVLLTDTDERPAVGEVVHFGLLASESMPLIVSGVEAGEDFSCHFRMIDAAPIIDQLTDAEVAPAWNGRVGGEIDPPTTPPAMPVWEAVDTGFTGTGAINGLVVTLSPGTNSSTETQLIRIEHRLSSASVWSPRVIDAGAGGVSITGYVRGDSVQLRAVAIVAGGIESAYTSVVTVVVGGKDGEIPGAAITGISVTALLGGATIAFQTTDDASVAAVQISRGLTSSFTDASPIGAAIPVQRSRSYTQSDGDTTRSTIVALGDFSAFGTWAYGTNWALTGGKAVHTAGSPGNLAQTINLSAGKTYRIGYVVSGQTAGTVRTNLTDASGGSVINGTLVSSNGDKSDRILADTTSAQIRFLASGDFDGAIDDVVVFTETSTCLPAGTHFYWLSPLNSIGVPGTAVGPYAVNIR